MKHIFLTTLFSFGFIFSCFSQIESGEVIYSINKNPNEVLQNKNKPHGYQELKRKIENIVTTLEFDLKFNKVNSLFSIKKKLAIDKTEMYNKTAIRITRGDRIFFNDKEKKILLEQIFFLGNYFIIKSSIDDLKWTLTKEQKRIGDYLCLKATASKEIETHLKEKKMFNYTAWYCPEIPFNFGPYEITGLPGLVLEFSNGKFIYSAKEIKLSENKIIIDTPSKGKIVTKEEFNSIGKKAFEELGH